MEKPQTIVGFKVGRSLVDELDVLSLVKAQQAWRKIRPCQGRGREFESRFPLQILQPGFGGVGES